MYFKVFEQLNKIDDSKSLSEGAYQGGYASGGSVDTYKRAGGSTQSSKSGYLTRLVNRNAGLEIITIKGKDLKPNMFTQTGQIEFTKLAYAPYYGKDMMYIMHTNKYDEFRDPNKDVEVLADPNDNSKPFDGSVWDLSHMGVDGIF